MMDISGREILKGDWVAYATRSYGQHDLKIARVKEIHKAARPHGRYFQLGVIIENFNVAGKYYTAMIQPEYMLVIQGYQVPNALLDKFIARDSNLT